MKLAVTAKLTAVALAGLVLAGCSIFDDEEPTYKFLQPFDQQVQPRVVWDESVGSGVGEYFSHLNPVTDAERIFAADREGVVAALNKANGQTIWQVNLLDMLGLESGGFWSSGEPVRISGGLTFAEGRLYLASENGDVVVLNADNGELIWHAQVDSEILADPAVGDGLVVVKGATGEVIALDAETGEQVWDMVTESPALSLRGTAAPVMTAGGVFVGTATGKLMVIIAENGQPAWESRLAVPKGNTELQRMVDLDSAAVVSGGLAYNVAYNGQLAAIELRTGRTVWTREYSSFQNLIMAGGRLFLTDHEDTVSSVNTDGGVEIWSNTDYTGRGLTAPVRFGNYIVVGDSLGYLHFLDLLSGDTVGRLEVGEGVYVAPVADGDTLYLQLRDGTLLAVRI